MDFEIKDYIAYCPKCSVIVLLNNNRFACVGISTNTTLISNYMETFTRFGDWEEEIPDKVKKRIPDLIRTNIVVDMQKENEE